MKCFEFWIPVHGLGDNAQEAWQDAIESLQAGIAEGRFNEPPADIFEEDKPVPAAEILGGLLSFGFGIDKGEKEIEEINPHGMPED